MKLMSPDHSVPGKIVCRFHLVPHTICLAPWIFFGRMRAKAAHSISLNTGPTGTVDGQKPAPDGRTKHIAMRETVTISTDAGFSPSNRIKSMTAINGAEEQNMLQHCGVVMFDGE